MENIPKTLSFIGEPNERKKLKIVNSEGTEKIVTDVTIFMAVIQKHLAEGYTFIEKES